MKQESSMTTTKLGKIERVTFGLGGYNDACLGIHFLLSGESWCVGTTKSAWDAELIKSDSYTKWTEEERSKKYDEIMRYISRLLSDAKVSSIDRLKGIPIEATFHGQLLHSWRILKEVL